ncbi:50S ribosomal protein L25/general stress protein Ctc [Mesonia oceanica]|uniref:General stress protein CTC n=1 Tax=Mesonia oceanica TaxID=2687242 RepID=A0AC61Y5F4_9FLAO|nr:50S ribosomal protein L25/general stress protein Ctc [Mesonia oceanica]MAQ40756.1 50S ribosomal protein L25/general stress protein Ctc [Mesonia sp.]MBJ98461.1 50S ribosomal protein L25/general stress protein Ctc [Flavobacteriaceae bacterium]VVU99077.1 General stress protein CTC [Mesonia oceanica]|tara:strand:- start:7053 stop:7700 length:648 start_codon:yes stop_codon:yes gene_type:complete
MKSITINGSKRESVGKKSTKALRNAGEVPCVLYGGEQAIHFSAPEVSFNSLIYTPDVHTVVLEFDGAKHNAVLQDIQFHPVTDEILHMDFYEFGEDQEISMEIPVHAEGIPRGVKNGGVLRFNLRRMKVRGLAAKLPDYIVADVTPLKIGNKLYVTAVQSEDYTILHPDNTVICQVKTSRNIVAVEDDDEDEVAPGDVPATETHDEGAAAASDDA